MQGNLMELHKNGGLRQRIALKNKKNKKLDFPPHFYLVFEIPRMKEAKSNDYEIGVDLIH